VSAAQPQRHALIVVMGVSGCGKSTIGASLARANGWVFLEGDDFHPAANIAKMSSGAPLTDEDRGAWIEAVRKTVIASDAAVIVLACSALTPFVRDGLNQTGRNVCYIHLSTDRVDMAARLEARDHFMPPDLLPSQYAALSVPDDAAEFDASAPPDVIISGISAHLQDVLNL